MSEPFFSVIVPVYQGGEILERCLAALRGSSFDSFELVVVDDGSTDDSIEVARRAGARVLETGGRRGPGRARNVGAAAAKGRYLLFLDADCEVEPGTLAALAAALEADPALAAAFGSYDDQPAETGFLSQYKNLQHHWVHQQGRAEASTFWAGCGAVRRDAFVEVGGFDVGRYTRPSIEDIELGYRLRAAGHRIRLVKRVRVKHHKSWSLAKLVSTDLFDRAVPWTELMLERGELANDLNVDSAGRVSGFAAWLLVAALAVAPFEPVSLVVALAAAVVLVWVNRRFYAFLAERRGRWFALRAVPVHWLYYLYSVMGFAVGSLKHLVGRRHG